ncbi:hypothetical protein VNI00_008339 [Paramarasmius palmivorus]|uniref:Uncharacterized protein n=1 Tax=Paramarasmius palmivorus TaxID=297713 RepID=A0AAW0CX47_9AGAR
MNNDDSISVSTTCSPPSHIATVSWNYTPPESSSKAVALPKGLFHSSRSKRRCHVSASTKAFPFQKSGSRSERDGWRKKEVDLELNADLVGVRVALSVLEDYETKVGIGGPANVDVVVPDLIRPVDEEEVAAHQTSWKELMAEMRKPLEDRQRGSSDVEQPSTSAPVRDGHIDSSLEQGISILSGLDLAEWDHRSPILPTPKVKVSTFGVASPIPRPARSCSSSPFGDSDVSMSLASSLSDLKRTPTPPLSFSTDSSPKSSATSASPPPYDFVIPSLSGTSLPPKIHLEKDDQGFFSGVEETSSPLGHLKSSSTTSLLPPFLLDEGQKRKPSHSKTRTMVDRLRNDSQKQDDTDVPTGSATPHKPQIVADVDGWIGVSEPYRPDQAMAERKRELFLALNKPLEPSPKKPQNPSPKSHSNANPVSSQVTNDGWIDFVQKPPPQPKHARSRSHNKRPSNGSALTPHTAPPAQTTFRPPNPSIPPPPNFYYPPPRAIMPVPVTPAVPFAYAAYPPAPAVVPPVSYVPYPMAPYSMQAPPPPPQQLRVNHVPIPPMTAVYPHVAPPSGKVPYFPPLPSMVRPGSLPHPTAW